MIKKSCKKDKNHFTSILMKNRYFCVRIKTIHSLDEKFNEIGKNIQIL